MPSSDDLLDLFRKSGALLDGHFRLTSGLHSTGYLQCALVLQHPPHAEALGRAIGDTRRRSEATVVLSPALGGIVIGHEVARALGVRAVFAERQDGALTLRRGFMLAETDRVLVVEDVVTTGGSTRETIQVAAAAGGRVVGAASIVDRGGAGAPSTCRSDALVSIDAADLRAGALPVVRPGAAGRQAGVQARRVRPDVQADDRLRRDRFHRMAAPGVGRLDPGTARRRARRARGRPVAVIGAGRTDAGVHARGQVAAARLEREIDAAAVVRAVNIRLPACRARARGIAVPGDFHARFDARLKTLPLPYLECRRDESVRAVVRLARADGARRRGDGSRRRGALAARTTSRRFKATGSDTQTTVRTVRSVGHRTRRRLDRSSSTRSPAKGSSGTWAEHRRHAGGSRTGALSRGLDRRGARLARSRVRRPDGPGARPVSDGCCLR